MRRLGSHYFFSAPRSGPGPALVSRSGPGPAGTIFSLRTIFLCVRAGTPEIKPLFLSLRTILFPDRLGGPSPPLTSSDKINLKHGLTGGAYRPPRTPLDPGPPARGTGRDGIRRIGPGGRSGLVLLIPSRPVPWAGGPVLLNIFPQP